MVGELDAGKPHVQFDEGAQETCDCERACALLYRSPWLVSGGWTWEPLAERSTAAGRVVEAPDQSASGIQRGARAIAL